MHVRCLHRDATRTRSQSEYTTECDLLITEVQVELMSISAAGEKITICQDDGSATRSISRTTQLCTGSLFNKVKGWASVAINLRARATTHTQIRTACADPLPLQGPFHFRCARHGGGKHNATRSGSQDSSCSGISEPRPSMGGLVIPGASEQARRISRNSPRCRDPADRITRAYEPETHSRVAHRTTSASLRTRGSCRVVAEGQAFRSHPGNPGEGQLTYVARSSRQAPGRWLHRR